MLLGYKELCEHIFSVKAMGADHKKAAEKMSNIKKKVRLGLRIIDFLEPLLQGEMLRLSLGE